MCGFVRRMLLAGCMFGAAAGSACGGEPDFAVRCIEMDGPGPCSALPGDFDGDGRADLLIWDGERLRLYVDSGEEIRPAGDSFDLPSACRLFDTGDPTGSGIDRLVYLAPGGVWWVSVGAGKTGEPVLWMEADPALSGSYVGSEEFVTDIDGDGRDDAWFPEAARLRILLACRAGEISVAEGLPLVQAEHSLEAEGLPFRLMRADLGGGDSHDLLCVTPDGLSAFRLEVSPGRLGASSQWHFPFAQYLENGDARRFATERVNDVLFIEDITGDGRPDLLLNSWSRGEAVLFVGTEAIFDARPSQTFIVGPEVAGMGSIPWRSFDRRAVVISRFEMPGKVSSLLSLLLRRGVSATLSFFLFEPEQNSPRFDTQPRMVRKALVSARWKDRDRHGLHRLFYSTRGDFNGDGWRDLVTLADGDAVEFYWAKTADEFAGRNRKGLLSLFSTAEPAPMNVDEFFEWSHGLILEQVGFRPPDLRVAVPTADGFAIGSEHCEDINRDGRMDLLLPYLPMDDGRFKFVFLLSRE
jgi:hypothetical protein